ncbi:NUDIX domain-containing protein [Methylovulum psychrotolerans]|jgi:ADP-ribose pyrophosphatase|uniref:ADP-ribose pyrophosphatase n=1 Tax=Methylovulum psychrotolerans TaxID=1704499 RepID=A0A1Z4BXW7_9GAMM|nr:NUDIX domain-containing protein [Methylovulum psychrotolerans]ASF46099.1 ADP-ribose diphosphatase [Methylovulum psychrotolerans]MBT9096638.1 NUDIX domain-containing protein [Methylovulum psychrotolerans]POZ51846.1 ADP-ribose diphosphatase [Methylovulum psychrotolerans]
MSQAFSILNHEILYNGFFRLEKYRLKHTLYAGGWSAELDRELFIRGECVGVLLYDPNTDQVVLIEQFRVGALVQPDRAWLVEIVAGAIEEGETAAEVAYREALEEAGCAIEELLEISRFYTSPGGTAERLTLFCGKVDSTAVGGVYGLAEEHEDILVRAVDFADAYRMLETREIESAIPIIAIQWLALNRTMLRQRWAATPF